MSGPDERADTVPDDDRPWERPGALRRDYEPHRGHWLVLLAWLALGFALCSLCLIPFTLFSIPLGAAVARMAGHDLRQMEVGRLDPGGRAVTERADGLGLAALLCSVLGWLLCFPYHLGFWLGVVRE